ncbi:M118/m119 protein [Murid betaherpesvirus 1]|nr:M118/m119 protein [Murid betaherpesvirus 1]
MLRLVLFAAAFHTAYGVKSVSCHDAETYWNYGANVSCSVTLHERTGGMFAIDCFWKAHEHKPWHKISRLDSYGWTHFESDRRSKYYNNTASLKLSYDNKNHILNASHSAVAPGVTFFKCHFYHRAMTRDGEAEWKEATWKVTAYPLISLNTGFQVKDLFVRVTYKNRTDLKPKKKSRPKGMSISVYHEKNSPFTPTSNTSIQNENGTITYLMTFSVPWADSQGNATVDVMVDNHNYKKLFLFRRHSTRYYAALTVLLVLAALVVIAYIVHRHRGTLKARLAFRYNRDLE